MMKNKERYGQLENNGVRYILNSKIVKEEEKLNKDIAEFNKEELLNLFKGMGIKTQSALSYTAHISNYKDWYKENVNSSIPMEIPNANDIRERLEDEEYNIVTDKDIITMTEKIYFDDSDLNLIVFMRLFWEIDGQEKEQDILNLKIDDFDFEGKTVTIKNHKYSLSSWLLELVKDYSEMSELVFQGKKGSYAIFTAKENEGYIFRKTKTKRTKTGTHITKGQLANLFYQYSLRRLDILLSLNDLKMSLAMRHMVQNEKTPTEMLVEKRYLNLAYSNIYKRVFDKFSYKFRQNM